MGCRKTVWFAACLTAVGTWTVSLALCRGDEQEPPLAPAGQSARQPTSGAARPEGAPPIMRHDRNHDGKVSRDEAPPRIKEHFDRIDANGDGFIDEVEARQHAERLRPRGREGDGPWGRRGPWAGARDAETEPRKTGLLRSEPGACEGYTLFAPMLSTTTYLIDMKGNVVHSWESDTPPGQAVYLLDNGNLLRCDQVRGSHTFAGGGLGGKIEEMDWDGNVVWEYVYADDKHMQHHDIEPLPNGNVLLIAWERKSKEETIAAGRNPGNLERGELWPDHVVEVKPTRPRGGKIVWEWHVWDHLIQDHDPSKANYGVVAEHPELIDINYPRSAAEISPQEQQRLEALGYVVPAAGPGPRHGDPDCHHTNSVAYNAELDQIALSVLKFNEVWIIDHSTTTKEAAGHSGGRSGKGGDLLYRWGNPQAYRAGTTEDQQLFAQHDARWIPRGTKGAGHLLVFNNGRGRPDGHYSSVDEIIAPVDERGRYAHKPGTAFGPAKPAWVYAAPDKSSFFAGHVSGADRLANGNTLICSGEDGRLFEVASSGKIVWEYANPFGGELAAGPPGMRGGGPPAGRFDGEGPHTPRLPIPDLRADGQRHGPPSGPPGGGRFGPGGPPHGPGGDAHGMFRATRLAPDHPGLVGKELQESKQ
jgi:hypothetical protein